MTVDPMTDEELAHWRDGTWKRTPERGNRLAARIDAEIALRVAAEDQANYWQMNCQETIEVEGERRAKAEEERDQLEEALLKIRDTPGMWAGFYRSTAMRAVPFTDEEMRVRIEAHERPL